MGKNGIWYCTFSGFKSLFLTIYPAGREISVSNFYMYLSKWENCLIIASFDIEFLVPRFFGYKS